MDTIDGIINTVSSFSDIKLPQQTRVNSLGELVVGKELTEDEIKEYLRKIITKDPGVFLGMKFFCV